MPPSPRQRSRRYAPKHCGSVAVAPDSVSGVGRRGAFGVSMNHFLTPRGLREPCDHREEVRRQLLRGVEDCEPSIKAESHAMLLRRESSRKCLVDENWK